MDPSKPASLHHGSSMDPFKDGFQSGSAWEQIQHIHNVPKTEQDSIVQVFKSLKVNFSNKTYTILIQTCMN